MSGYYAVLDEDSIDLTEGKEYYISGKRFLDDEGDLRVASHYEWRNCFVNSSAPVVSDGGSSSYYEVPLPEHVLARIAETGCIEVKDFVKYGLDNDFDAGNIVKATKRIIEAKKGSGKSGTNIEYDANKIKFFAEEIKL